jgi:hypothetical protein
MQPSGKQNRVKARNADRRNWEQDAKDWRRKLEKLDKHEAALLASFRREQISETALDSDLAAVARERSALRTQLETAGAGRSRARRRAAGSAGCEAGRVAHARPERSA